MSYPLRVAVTVALALFGGAAAAARADAKREAATHLERATQLHGDGRLADALNELTVAYALDPVPDLLYAIAQIRVQLGDCANAIPFYERFLSTRPTKLAADAAREAITTCRDNPPPPAPPPPPEPEPVAPVIVAPVVDASPPPPPPSVESPRWYRDRTGLALIGGGVALAVGGAVTYSLARTSLDEAEHAASYGGYQDAVDRAHGERLAAGLLFAAGGVLTTIGVVHLWRHADDGPRIAMVPAGHGGVVTVGGRF